MAIFYSDHYSPLVGETNHFTTINSIQPAVNVGFKHSRVRRTSCLLSVPSGQDLGSADQIRLFDLSSNDRLIEIRTSMDGNWGGTSTFDLGLYTKGTADDGAVVDINLFGRASDWQNAIARTDDFTTGALDTWDRGKALWELANIGVAATTYGTTTNAIWTVVATTTQDISDNSSAVEFMAEAFYVAGD